jgi:hypothetical protein
MNKVSCLTIHIPKKQNTFHVLNINLSFSWKKKYWTISSHVKMTESEKQIKEK